MGEKHRRADLLPHCSDGAHTSETPQAMKHTLAHCMLMLLSSHATSRHVPATHLLRPADPSRRDIQCASHRASAAGSCAGWQCNRHNASPTLHPFPQPVPHLPRALSTSLSSSTIWVTSGSGVKARWLGGPNVAALLHVKEEV